MKRVAIAALIAASCIALYGCGPEKLDTSSGNFGKMSQDTKLPPQPDPAAVARSRAANPQGAPAPNAGKTQ